MFNSADQLSRFVLDNQGIDHFVKVKKNEKYGNVKEKIASKIKLSRNKN